MQVGGGDPIIPEFKTEKAASKKLKHTGIKPREEKSKEKSVDNLKSRIRDDYQPKTKASKGLVYPKGAEDLPKPVINITHKSSPIDQKIPLDILKFALSKVSSEDLVSTSMVSKYWGYASLEVAKVQEASLLKSFGNFLNKNISEKYPDLAKKLLEITQNSDFSLAKDLPDLKDILLQSRFKIIGLLFTLKKEDLANLEVSSVMIKKPLSFDVLFDLVTLHKYFFISLSVSHKEKCVDIVKQFCDLGSLDMAFNALTSIKNKFGENEVNQSYNKSFKYILKSLLEIGDIEKVMELVLPATSLRVKEEIVRDLFSRGKIDEGIILANGFPDRERNYPRYSSSRSIYPRRQF